MHLAPRYSWGITAVASLLPVASEVDMQSSIRRAEEMRRVCKIEREVWEFILNLRSQSKTLNKNLSCCLFTVCQYVTPLLSNFLKALKSSAALTYVGLTAGLENHTTLLEPIEAI